MNLSTQVINRISLLPGIQFPVLRFLEPAVRGNYSLKWIS
jgi:hypothetical protein